MVLSYIHRRGAGDWRDENYSVQLDWTPCHFGGERPWFRCPGHNCGRRVAILYGGAVFACRSCHNLAYPSQWETPDDRAARQAERIRRRLDWARGILNGPGSKPKGMHWRSLLIAEHDALVAKSVTEMARRFGIKVLTGHTKAPWGNSGGTY